MDLSIPDHSVLPNRTSFPLPSQSYPNPLRSLRGSSTLASSSPSPNPNYWEFWEPWFHCPHFCLLQADLRPRKESVGGGLGYLSSRSSARGQRPQSPCKPAPPQHLSPPVPTPTCSSPLPGWVLPLSLGPGRAWGGVSGREPQTEQTRGCPGSASRDARRSKRGLCPRQRPLLLSAKDRLSPGPVPVSCPLKEGESLLPQQKSFLFHSPVLKPDLDLLVTKIQAV